MSLRRLRERINLFIYDSKSAILRVFRLLNIIVTLTAVSTLIYYYGVPQTPESASNALLILKTSFGFYLFHFFLRWFYDFEPLQFLRRHWIETLIMSALFLEGVSYTLFGKILLHEFFTRIGFEGFTDVSAVFVQLYFFSVLLIGFTRRYTIKPFLKLHPAALFLFTFILLILIGTGLLMLPEMIVSPGSLSFIDALFTSTSASCVTGLSVIDVAQDLSFKGQVVVLLLITVGGLNIVGFVAFIILMSRFGIGVKYHSFMDDYARKGTIDSALQMLRKIVLLSLAFELIGAVSFYVFIGADNPLTPTEGSRVFASVFHSISAFNNAGFSIFQHGLHNEHIASSYFIHIVIMVLIFFGSLGFAAMFDIFSPENLRERMRKPWKRFGFNTKVALYFSLILVFVGALLFFVLEYNHTLSGKNTGEAVITSLFHSVTTRTAGFNTVDISQLTLPVMILFLFLMFVGASSNSTGGGIKTSTFAILWASAIATMRDKKQVELFKRTIRQETVLKAFTILLFFISWNLLAILILSITEQEIIHLPGRGAEDIIFEQVSAFSSAGLSTGITPLISPLGKMVLTVSMFVGKIGALTLAYLFGRKLLSKNYLYPHADAVVG